MVIKIYNIIKLLNHECFINFTILNYKSWNSAN